MRFDLAEGFQIVTVLAPVNLLGGANTGDRVHLGKDFRRVTFLIAKAAGGTGGEDPVVTLREHDAVTSGNSADLAKISRVYSKQAATDLTAVGQFTIVQQAAAATFSNGTLAEEAALLAFEVDADDLSAGFEWVSVDIADPGSGNAQLACVLAILHSPRHLMQVAASAIA
jgi:hypothetical protein